jgi:RNA methyltransferase, TrmH family
MGNYRVNTLQEKIKMNKQKISSLSNTVCKKISSLRQRKYRRETNSFVLEGLHSIQDAVNAGWKPVLFVSAESFHRIPGAESLINQLAGMNTEWFETTDSVMGKLSETETPQGILAVFNQQPLKLHDLLERRPAFILVLDRIQDPGNLGTLIRSAEAAGVEAVLVTHGSTDPYNSKTLRASTGAVLHIPVIELSEDESSCRILKESGILLVGAALENSVPYNRQYYQSPLALIIGNESKGINECILEQADLLVSIPMKGNLQSLNAAIAGSILMFSIAEHLDLS